MRRIHLPDTAHVGVHERLRTLAVGRLPASPDQGAGLGFRQRQSHRTNAFDLQSRHRRHPIAGREYVAPAGRFRQGPQAGVRPWGCFERDRCRIISANHRKRRVAQWLGVHVKKSGLTRIGDAGESSAPETPPRARSSAARSPPRWATVRQHAHSSPHVFIRPCPFSFLDNRRKVRSVRVDHLSGQVLVLRKA